MLIDTHCHIHEADYPLDIDETILRAHEAGVDQFLCVGTSLDSSRRAVEFAKVHQEAFATIGVHPHETKDGWEALGGFLEEVKEIANSHIPYSNSHIVAVGEIGLDYYYNHSPRDVQIQALEWQIELALQHNLPIIFHVRDAFVDFWPIFDNFTGIKGELHSFTDNQANLDEGLKRGLYIGVNGISTFTKDEAQKQLFAGVPLDRLLLETDAPFLTPVPFRGKPNEPAYVKNVAEYNAMLRGITLDQIANATSANAHALFNR